MLGDRGGLFLLFFDLDNTLLDFKAAESEGIGAVYAALRPRLELDREAFHTAWEKVGEEHFHCYLRGESTFIQQRDRARAIAALAG